MFEDEATRGGVAAGEDIRRDKMRGRRSATEVERLRTAAGFRIDGGVLGATRRAYDNLRLRINL